MFLQGDVTVVYWWRLEVFVIILQIYRQIFNVSL